MIHGTTVTLKVSNYCLMSLFSPGVELTYNVPSGTYFSIFVWYLKVCRTGNVVLCFAEKKALVCRTVLNFVRSCYLYILLALYTTSWSSVKCSLGKKTKKKTKSYRDTGSNRTWKVITKV